MASEHPNIEARQVQGGTVYSHRPRGLGGRLGFLVSRRTLQRFLESQPQPPSSKPPGKLKFKPFR